MAIYCALCCVILTSVLAFSFSDMFIMKVAKHIINISAIICGPVLFLGSVYGFYNVKALARVCGVSGIKDDDVNVPSLMLLVIFFIISTCVSYCMIYVKTMNVANSLFTNEHNLLFTITTLYFRYNQRMRE